MYQCETCGKQFKTHVSVIRHIYYEHSGESNYTYIGKITKANKKSKAIKIYLPEAMINPGQYYTARKEQDEVIIHIISAPAEINKNIR